MATNGTPDTNATTTGRRRITGLSLRVAAALALSAGGCGYAAATGSAPSPIPAGATVTATATPTPAPAPPHALIGAFHFSSNDFKIDSKAPTELVMATTVLHPGRSSGWHTHPGPAFVIVMGGTVTRYQLGTDGTCTSATYTVGQGFVEAPDTVHIARNEGTVDVTLQATFLDVAPGTVAFKSPAPAPEGCPGIS